MGTVTTNSTEARGILRRRGWSGPAIDIAMGTARLHGIYPQGSSRTSKGFIAYDGFDTYTLKLARS